MTHTAVELEELRSVVADVIDIEPESLTDTARFVDDLHVDSLIALELAVVLQRRYGVTIAESEVVNLRTLPDVQVLLAAKTTEDA